VFTLGNDHVEIVESFIFLDSEVEVSGECGDEMNGWLSLGRTLGRIDKDLERQRCDNRNQEKVGECSGISSYNVLM